MSQQLSRQYKRLKTISLADLAGADVAQLISEMALHACDILRSAERVPLKSQTGKNYFSFRAAQQSRPINAALYADQPSEFERLLRVFQNGFAGSAEGDIIRATYSAAYSVFSAHDIYEVGRKASATFFEILIGHICAQSIGVPPRNKVQIPESGANLPTDYIFDPGPKSRKIHLPIKTSTRERAVQAWVHQLVLDRIFGADQYLGVLVVASETKRDSRTGEVIEICVPRQLQMFQARVAKMSRVYYLDPPKAYLDLANDFPRIEVRPFGQALVELKELVLAR